MIRLKGYEKSSEHYCPKLLFCYPASGEARRHLCLYTTITKSEMQTCFFDVCALDFGAYCIGATMTTYVSIEEDFWGRLE